MIVSAALFAGLVLRRGCNRETRVAMGGATGHGYNDNFDKKHWHIRETRDPTTLPLWERDWRSGFKILRQTMREERKKGGLVFWDVRVIESDEKKCTIEMLNSGIVGLCMRSQEGPERLEVGAVVKMECLACPTLFLKRKPAKSTYPKHPEWKGRRPMAIFSHQSWLQFNKNLAKAKDLCAGDIIQGVVCKHIAQKGMVMSLEGDDGPSAVMLYKDISRKMASRDYCEKMFPEGTLMTMYVVHSDHHNGRITLSTKEFEDDDHFGWMLSFPERCMARAATAVGLYHAKRDRYIAYLQKR